MQERSVSVYIFLYQSGVVLCKQWFVVKKNMFISCPPSGFLKSFLGVLWQLIFKTAKFLQRGSIFNLQTYSWFHKNGSFSLKFFLSICKSHSRQLAERTVFRKHMIHIFCFALLDHTEKLNEKLQCLPRKMVRISSLCATEGQIDSVYSVVNS